MPLCARGWAIYWSMGGLEGPTSLKQSEYPSSSSHWLPMSSHCQGWDFVLLSPMHDWMFVWLGVAKVLFSQSQPLWVDTDLSHVTLPFLKALRSQKEGIVKQKRRGRKTGKARAIGGDSHFLLKSVCILFSKRESEIMSQVSVSWLSFHLYMHEEHTLQIPLNVIPHDWMSFAFSYVCPMYKLEQTNLPLSN